MIHHIVMWKLKDFADGRTKNENAELMKQGLEGLRENIRHLKKIEVGINMEGSQYSNFDIVMDSFFDNYADMETYQKHPLHEEISAWIGTIREIRASVDYEI